MVKHIEDLELTPSHAQTIRMKELEKQGRIDDNVIFIQLFFAFLFSISCEFFWEILEFTVDHYFATNMQRFIKNGIMLQGHDAIKDTIKDMIVASIGGSSIIFLSKIKLIKNAKIRIK